MRYQSVCGEGLISRISPSYLCTSLSVKLSIIILIPYSRGSLHIYIYSFTYIHFYISNHFRSWDIERLEIGCESS